MFKLKKGYQPGVYVPLMALFLVLYILLYEPRSKKTSFRVFDLVPHKPGCTATEDG